MGKYMRKSKAAMDVAAMERAQSSLGVRTRAKTLALQRLQQSVANGGSSYLQLRSRKLEKPLTAGDGVQRRKSVQRNPSPILKTGASSSRLRVSSSLVVENHMEEIGKESRSENLKSGGEIGVDGVGDCEPFFGENSPDFHAMERSTRESTPCSFIRDPDHAGTPGSATKPSSSVKISKRMHNPLHNRLMPTAKEIEEFFAVAEQQQHRQFIEKYNFDPKNEKPLPGRYDWEKVDPPQEAPAQLF